MSKAVSAAFLAASAAFFPVFACRAITRALQVAFDEAIWQRCLRVSTGNDTQPNRPDLLFQPNQEVVHLLRSSSHAPEERVIGASDLCDHSDVRVSYFSQHVYKLLPEFVSEQDWSSALAASGKPDWRRLCRRLSTKSFAIRGGSNPVSQVAIVKFSPNNTRCHGLQRLTNQPNRHGDSQP